MNHRKLAGLLRREEGHWPASERQGVGIRGLGREERESNGESNRESNRESNGESNTKSNRERNMERKSNRESKRGKSSTGTNR